MDPFDRVYERIGAAEVLARLAEEAAELSNAALRLRRVLVKEHPDAMRVGKAMAHLYEEIADMQNCLTVLDVSGQLDKGDIERLRAVKMDLWVRELEE